MSTFLEIAKERIKTAKTVDELADLISQAEYEGTRLAIQTIAVAACESGTYLNEAPNEEQLFDLVRTIYSDSVFRTAGICTQILSRILGEDWSAKVKYDDTGKLFEDTLRNLGKSASVTESPIVVEAEEEADGDLVSPPLPPKEAKHCSGCCAPQSSVPNSIRNMIDYLIDDPSSQSFAQLRRLLTELAEHARSEGRTEGMLSIAQTMVDSQGMLTTEVRRTTEDIRSLVDWMRDHFEEPPMKFAKFLTRRLNKIAKDDVKAEFKRDYLDLLNRLVEDEGTIYVVSGDRNEVSFVFEPKRKDEGR